MARPVRLVIFDLDGTLLDTGDDHMFLLMSNKGNLLRENSGIEKLTTFHVAESLIVETASSVLGRHGHQLTPQAQADSLGKTALQSWQATINSLGMKNVSAEQLVAESEPLLTAR